MENLDPPSSTLKSEINPEIGYVQSDFILNALNNNLGTEFSGKIKLNSFLLFILID